MPYKKTVNEKQTFKIVKNQQFEQRYFQFLNILFIEKDLPETLFITNFELIMASSHSSTDAAHANSVFRSSSVTVYSNIEYI